MSLDACQAPQSMSLDACQAPQSMSLDACQAPQSMSLDACQAHIKTKYIHSYIFENEGKIFKKFF